MVMKIDGDGDSNGDDDDHDDDDDDDDGQSSRAPWLSDMTHDTREKLLRATICFSIERARARHAPTWCIWCQFHLSINFSLKTVQGQNNPNIFYQKRWHKNNSNLRQSIVYI